MFIQQDEPRGRGQTKFCGGKILVEAESSTFRLIFKSIGAIFPV
jgi:hypothetical protein